MTVMSTECDPVVRRLRPFEWSSEESGRLRGGHGCDQRGGRRIHRPDRRRGNKARTDPSRVRVVHWWVCRWQRRPLGLVAERAVPSVVVTLFPVGDHDAGLGQAPEEVDVQAFVAEPAVERFDVADAPRVNRVG
jgi:hypothetical protein